MNKNDLYDALDFYGRKGMSALSSSTPVDTGLTASSWSYTIDKGSKRSSIYWTNTNIITGTPVVIWLQYGHGTGTGGYVQGRDFINPAIQPIFDEIADAVWREVVNA